MMYYRHNLPLKNAFLSREKVPPTSETAATITVTINKPAPGYTKRD